MNRLEEIVAQINQLFYGAERVNFVTTFVASELSGCTAISEALPTLTQVYAPDSTSKSGQIFHFEIRSVRPFSFKDIWGLINKAFDDRGDYDLSRGVRFSAQEEAKLDDLREAFIENVRNYLKPDTLIYSFSSGRWTVGLFGLAILNKDGSSVAIAAHNSD